MALTAPFRFKQFSVAQTRSAMKVGFDGILLGAWVNVVDCQRILDVGTGTGLIALMLAQRTMHASTIHAIEIDPSSALEASDNFRASPWSNRLTVEQAAFRQFSRDCEQTFDLIVCNPPYFSGPESNELSRRHARHANSLPLELLFAGSRRLLRESGRLAVIIPSQREKETRNQSLRHGWMPCRELRTRPLVDRSVNRVLIEFTRAPCLLQSGELAIETSHHQYTDEFRALARDFYLAF